MALFLLYKAILFWSELCLEVLVPLIIKIQLASTDISPPPTAAAVAPPKPDPEQLLHADNTAGCGGEVIMTKGLIDKYKSYSGPYCHGSFVADSAQAAVTATKLSTTERHTELQRRCTMSVVV